MGDLANVRCGLVPPALAEFAVEPHLGIVERARVGPERENAWMAGLQPDSEVGESRMLALRLRLLAEPVVAQSTHDLLAFRFRVVRHLLEANPKEKIRQLFASRI